MKANVLIKTSQNSVGPPPIWIMRQAGRYLPEYRGIRQTVSTFLDLCYNPKKAATVTLQPLKRFDINIAIIFSDILVLPNALGVDVKFIEGVGPILKKFENYEDLVAIKKNTYNISKLNNVYEAIALVKDNLSDEKSLIGFAGSPWTVVSYMLEGKGKQSTFETSKCFIYNNKDLAKELIDFITEKTIIHLKSQIEAGATIIKLFDSWSGVLSEDEYDDFVINPTKKIVQELKQKHPTVPIIGFPRGSGFLYEKYIDNTGVDIIATDQFVPLYKMRKWQEKIIVQGNLDPLILLTNKEIIKNKVEKLLSSMKRKNYIFNLGHGILPNTPIENIGFLINYISKYDMNYES